MAKFMEKIGATPVTMAFGEVAQGLSLGTIDCAVTGPSSANSAGWPESVTHVYPLALQVAVQGYGISLPAWNRLQSGPADEAEGRHREADGRHLGLFQGIVGRCHALQRGQDPCTTGKKYKLTTVECSRRIWRRCRARARDFFSGLVRGLRQGQSRLLGGMEGLGRAARRPEVIIRNRIVPNAPALAGASLPAAELA